MKSGFFSSVELSASGLLAAAFLAAGVQQLQAAVVATWDFTPTFTAGTTVNIGGTPGSYVSAANLNGGITAGGSSTITRVATGGQSGAYMQFNPRTSGNGQPMSFILQLTASAPMNNFSISYYARVSATTGSDINTWAYSLNNGTSWTTMTTQPAGPTTTAWAQYTASQNASVSAGSTIWFRNTLTGATANNINAEFDTFSVTAVPEPVNIALGVFGAGIGFVSLGRWARNRKSATKAA
jgi:hypothetical protein